MTETHQGGVDAILESGAVTHQVQPPARSFPFRVIEDVDIETLAAEIQSDVQHMGRGLLYGLDAETPHSLPTGGPSSSHSHSVRSGELPDTMRTEVRTAPRSDGRPTARGQHLGAGGDPAENLTCGALQINRVTALLTLL